MSATKRHFGTLVSLGTVTIDGEDVDNAAIIKMPTPEALQELGTLLYNEIAIVYAAFSGMDDLSDIEEMFQ